MQIDVCKTPWRNTFSERETAAYLLCGLLSAYSTASRNAAGL